MQRNFYLILLVYGTLLSSGYGHCNISGDLISNADSEEVERKALDKHIDTRLSKLENDMQKVKTETVYGNAGARTAPANPQFDGYGLFATADFLWWKLYEGGSDYLLKSKANFPIHGTVRDFSFNWEPGFKVGVGYIFEHDSWDANAEYTYFKTHAHHSSGSNSLFPLVGDEELVLHHSKAHWNVNFQNLDVILGKSYFISKFVSLHPFFGLATAWIDQHRYFRFITSDAHRIGLKSKTNFWGIGPKLGFGSTFFLSERLSLYGNLSGNLLWGDFHIRERENDKTSSIEFYKLHYHLHRMVPSAAFSLGAVYEDNFADDAYHFMIKAGYESQYWWRQNQLPVFDSSTPAFHRVSEDLSMQGLTVELRLDF